MELLFPLEGKVAVPLAVELGVNEYIFIVKDCLDEERITVQLSLVGTQP